MAKRSIKIKEDCSDHFKGLFFVKFLASLGHIIQAVKTSPLEGRYGPASDRFRVDRAFNNGGSNCRVRSCIGVGDPLTADV